MVKDTYTRKHSIATMAERFTGSTHDSRSFILRPFASLTGVLLSLGLLMGPALAKDPFRSSEPRPIGDRTEAAFRAMFEQGNYNTARQQLEQAEADEPLAHAMKASLIYMEYEGEKDSDKKAVLLDRFKINIDRTQETAKQLMAKDPLRGNLYMAVGHFLEGAHIVLREGTVKGTPDGLAELQQAFKYLDAAEAKAPQDPELNLLKGYMDLLMSVNLPFSSPNKAIDRLEKFAGPRYLAYRGLALGYRDLKKTDKALAAVDRALQDTPENPDVMYLKAQILVNQRNYKDAVAWFDRALKKQDQLPPRLVRQINRERQRAEQKVNGQ